MTALVVFFTLWSLVAVLVGVIIGTGIRLADDRAPHAETPDAEQVAV